MKLCARLLSFVGLLTLGLNAASGELAGSESPSGTPAPPIFKSGFENGELHVYTIDFCRLQFPNTISENSGTQVTVYARLYIAGLTDQSGVNNPAPGVIGYVGYGADGSNPASGWTWAAGIPNPGYDNSAPSYEINNDEYSAVLSVPSPGLYDFAFRFSGDGGNTFTYCDLAPGGSSDGYSSASAGQMTAQ